MKGTTLFDSRFSPLKVAAVIGGSLLLLVGLIFGGSALLGAVTGFSSADGGHVIVVRNGGLFDDTSINRVIYPNSGLTYTGMWSTNHEYPTSQRNFTVSAAQGADSNEVIVVPTRDGVSVGITGTFYFQLNTDDAALRTLDNNFGTRTFNGHSAWDGDEGWREFLNVTLGNLVQNTLRQEIGSVKCAELQPACALAFNAQAQVADGKANQTLAQIQAKVTDTFKADIKSNFGFDIFTNVSFNLSSVSLPDEVQGKINAAQGAIAQANQDSQTAQINANKDLQASKIHQQQATVDQETSKIRQQGYAACPICAQIDLTKALPQGLTTYIPGQTNVQPSLPVGGN